MLKVTQWRVRRGKSICIKYSECVSVAYVFQREKLMRHVLSSVAFPAVPHFPHKQNKRVNVKCTLVQALRLCTGRTAHRGSRGIALPFHDHGTRRG